MFLTFNTLLEMHPQGVEEGGAPQGHAFQYSIRDAGRIDSIVWVGALSIPFNTLLEMR